MVVVMVVMVVNVNPFDEEVTIITAKYEDGQFVKKFSQRRTECIPDSIRHLGTFHHHRNNNSVVNDKASKNGHNNSIQDADS
jgi:hypothetical protein